MRASSLILLVGFVGFSISCAHKPALDEGAEKQAKIEKKAEKKAETKKDDTKKDDTLAYTCLVGKDQRLVTLDTREKRCEVNYTKFGDTQQVAWAEATPTICTETFDKIRNNIESSGYKCLEGKDVKFGTPQKQEAKTQEAKKPIETASN